MTAFWVLQVFVVPELGPFHTLIFTFLSTQQVCMEPYASAVDMMLPAAAAEAHAAIS